MRIISIYDFNMRNMIQWLKDKAMRCDDKTRSLSYWSESCFIKILLKEKVFPKPNLLIIGQE